MSGRDGTHIRRRREARASGSKRKSAGISISLPRITTAPNTGEDDFGSWTSVGHPLSWYTKDASRPDNERTKCFVKVYFQPEHSHLCASPPLVMVQSFTPNFREKIWIPYTRNKFLALTGRVNSQFNRLCWIQVQWRNNTCYEDICFLPTNGMFGTW